MQMSKSEIKTDVLQAADQKKQVAICAQVNGVSPEKIREILKEQGVDLRSLKGAGKKHINHGNIERKPYKKQEIIPEPPKPENETAKAWAVLLFRIAELRKQKEEIQAEIDAIVAQAQRLIEAGEKV